MVVLINYDIIKLQEYQKMTSRYGNVIKLRHIKYAIKLRHLKYVIRMTS